MLAVADHVRDTAPDLIGFPVPATGNVITLTGMQQAKHIDPAIAVQHLPATGGLVAQAYEITLLHRTLSIATSEDGG
jgi:hypothetical protein